MNLDHIIRERAYALWEQAGRIEGQAEEHWLRAERELSAPSAARGAAPVVGKKKRAGRSAARKNVAA
jgi:hypothetical protein